MNINQKEKLQISDLAREVALLRSFVIGTTLKDPEGEYKPEFVEDVLESINEPIVGEFSTPEKFLKLLDQYDNKN